MRIESQNNYNLFNQLSYGNMNRIESVVDTQKGVSDAVSLEISAAGVQAVKTGTTSVEYQQKLSGLGFFSGAFDGNLSSEPSKKAIRNFQRTYGIKQSGVLDVVTKNKLVNSYNLYNKIRTSSEMKSLCKDCNYAYDARQVEDFARTWAFLRVGMGVSSTVAAGVMGNIHAESNVSHDDAEEKAGLYAGFHNSEYEYKTDDGVGYGLIQWTYSERKKGLLGMANQMGTKVSDINAQLAYFRKEMTELEWSASWKSIASAQSVNEACDTFLEKVEQPDVLNYSQRRTYANKFYNCFKYF